MLAPKLEEQKELTLTALAREALEERDGNVAKAAGLLASRLRRDEKLLDTVVEEAITEVARARAHKLNTRVREAVIRSASRADVEALADGLAASFLDFPLSTGVRLRDATRDAIQTQAEIYRRMHVNTGHKFRWLERIAQAVPVGKKAGDVLDDSRLSELWRETQDA